MRNYYRSSISISIIIYKSRLTLEIFKFTIKSYIVIRYCVITELRNYVIT